MKVKEMKVNNIPEKFIKDVERQLNNLANLNLSKVKWKTADEITFEWYLVATRNSFRVF